jgi:hypothetical protein
MSCVLTNGYNLGCRDSIGGIQKVFIGIWDGDTTYGFTGSNNQIDSFSPTASYWTFEQEIETASFNQPGQFSTSAFYEQTLEITLQKLDENLRQNILILGKGIWRIIILDQRGTYWLMGKQNGVRVSDSTSQLGKAFGDLNGAVITFTGKEPELAHSVTSTAAATVIM